MEDSRETRRKRLTERRTDRLDFITGKNKYLTKSVPQDFPYSSITSGEDNFTSEYARNQSNEAVISNVLNSTQIDEPTSNPLTIRLLDEEILIPSPEEDEINGQKVQKDEPESYEHDKTMAGADTSGHLFTTSMLEKPADDDDLRIIQAAPRMLNIILNPSEISQSVLMTENIRLFIAIAAAFLVILSYKGLLVGGIVGSSSSFRPLLFVLLTDITIIMGWTLLKKGGKQRNEIEGRKAMVEIEGGRPNELSRILEIGEIIRSILGAIFLDCGICTIIMICGVVF